MSTVLIIEDQFLAGYELECALKERGYAVRHVATRSDAMQAFRALQAAGELAAVVCDNRLIDGEPAATGLYHAMREKDRFLPFVVYSGYPPGDLPKGDELLAIVHKPSLDRVVSHISAFAPVRGKGRDLRPRIHRQEAA